MIRVVRTPERLAQVLKHYRLLHNLTQQQVAAKAGLKQATVSVTEASAAHTRLATIYKLVAALELELVVQSPGTILRIRQMNKYDRL
jgi:HTH-type transcriptional regulator/antitoxin HipB